MNSPTTKEDWQLYTEMKGSGRAARSITAKFNRACRMIDQGLRQGLGLKESAEKAFSWFYSEGLTPWARWGALDTEPRNVGLDAIEQYIKEKHGVELRIDW